MIHILMLRGQEASTHGLIKMAIEVSKRESEKIHFHVLLNIIYLFIYLLFLVNLANWNNISF